MKSNVAGWCGLLLLGTFIIYNKFSRPNILVVDKVIYKGDFHTVTSLTSQGPIFKTVTLDTWPSREIPIDSIKVVPPTLWQKLIK